MEGLGLLSFIEVTFLVCTKFLFHKDAHINLIATCILRAMTPAISNEQPSSSTAVFPRAVSRIVQVDGPVPSYVAPVEGSARRRQGQPVLPSCFELYNGRHDEDATATGHRVP